MRRLLLMVIMTGGMIGMVNGPLYASGELRKAAFAGGCFWCMEPPFEALKGMTEVVSGYMGGTKKDPTYEEVSSGRTGYREVIQVTYDPSKISYEELLDVFWMQIDPTDAFGQFADKGTQYKTAIFYYDDDQKRVAEGSKKKLEGSGKFGKPIVTEILKASVFYPAEAHHQDYYKQSPLEYERYKKGSGRAGFIKEKWGDKTCGTEPPFGNEYWNNKREGIYVDIVSGEPLFSSLDKFDSGTGWPSFTKPLEPGNIEEKEDKSLFMKRIEVKSRLAGSHLGHVFDDGPKPANLRYCINSSALRFIPKEDLEKEGYGEYKKLFYKG